MSYLSRINLIGFIRVKFCLKTWFTSPLPRMIPPNLEELMCPEIMSQNSSLLIIESQPILSLLILGIIYGIKTGDGLLEQCR
mmetsp:Transcript_9038/g.11297  ORF Transcript_9038/g.11297 Transcript_9038/m.11297 type:complete len:82 (-) Transcript_9038:260-505(-)